MTEGVISLIIVLNAYIYYSINIRTLYNVDKGVLSVIQLMRENE